MGGEFPAKVLDAKIVALRRLAEEAAAEDAEQERIIAQCSSTQDVSRA